MKENKGVEFYRTSAEWLRNQDTDIYNKSTLILQPGSPDAAEGMREYYITKQGRDSSLNYLSFEEISLDDVLKFETIYIVHNNGDTPYEYAVVMSEYYEQVFDDGNVKVRKLVKRT